MSYDDDDVDVLSLSAAASAWAAAAEWPSTRSPQRTPTQALSRLQAHACECNNDRSLAHSYAVTLSRAHTRSLLCCSLFQHALHSCCTLHTHCMCTARVLNVLSHSRLWLASWRTGFPLPFVAAVVAALAVVAAVAAAASAAAAA